MSEILLRRAPYGRLRTDELYRLLRLRVDVFVVEQRCPYPELDGRDTHPDTEHVWYERDDRPLSYLRVLREPDGRARIGRVCTARAARGTGLAGRLLDVVVGRLGQRACVLDAQSHLTGFYRRHGFAPAGPQFIEDGIPHTPMVRPASARSANHPA